MPNVFREGRFPAATAAANLKLRGLILPLGILLLTATSRAGSPPDDFIEQLRAKRRPFAARPPRPSASWATNPPSNR